MTLRLHHINLVTDDVARLDRLGVPYADWGNRAVASWRQIFFDPDGNVIEVHQVDE